MKKLCCVLLAVALLLGLSACGKKQEEKAEGFVPALDKASKASIVVMGNYSNFEALEAAFEDFNRYYPEVALSYVKPDDYNNTIGMILDSDSAPNIYFTYNWMNGREQYESCFRHAEDLSDPALKIDLSCIRQSLLGKDAEGHVPMVPVFATTYGIMVNNNLFEKEGLKVPETYEELLAVCGTLKEKGYACPMLGYLPDTAPTSFTYNLIYPYFCGTVSRQEGAAQALAEMKPEAGEYMRPALNMLTEMMDQGVFNLEECRKLEDGYTAMILRFFEGDVPMLICTGDTVSGTRKRESQSEAFSAKPFTYSFTAIPAPGEGSWLLDTTSFHFSVNKDCQDLEMTNEFMRFLITAEELNKMAEIKRLVTPTTDLTFDNIYAPLAKIPAERTVSPEKLGLTDDVTIQVRNAAYSVITGTKTVDEVIAQYGTLE